MSHAHVFLLWLVVLASHAVRPLAEVVVVIADQNPSAIPPHAVLALHILIMYGGVEVGFHFFFYHGVIVPDPKPFGKTFFNFFFDF